MTDTLLRSYQFYSTTSLVPFPISVSAAAAGALGLLTGEADGFAIDATTADGGTVAVISTGDPTDNLSNVILDASNLTQAGTSPKMVHHLSSPYVRWSAHNLFLNSGSPATQNVTLISGLVYTYGITGTGSLAGASGASGTATAGSPVTFTATGTTGVFTVTGSPTTMWINRGATQVPYLATSGAIRIGTAQTYDLAASKYAMWLEPAATNLAWQSDDFSNFIWTKTDVTITANATTAPSGETTADLLTLGASGAASTIQALGSPSGVYTYSVYAKRGNSDWFFIFTSDGSNRLRAWFNLGTGAVGSTAATGGGVVTGSTITAIGDGWYRCTLTGDTGSAGFNFGLDVKTADGNATSANAGTVYAWGYQAETGTRATSVIPTIGATATRAADAVSALVTTFPGSDSNNTIYLDYKPLNVGSGTRYAWAYWKDVSNFYSLAGVTANPTMGNTNAGSPQFAVDLGTLVAGTRTQITIAAKGSDFDGSQDGAAATAQGTATLTTAYTTFYLGAFGTTGSELNGYIYRMVIVPYQRETVNGDVETWRYNF